MVNHFPYLELGARCLWLGTDGSSVREILMLTLDANVLLRWLLNDVPDQAAAAEALLSQAERFVVPDVVLIETVYVLERVMLLSRKTVALSVELVLGQANLAVDREVWRAALDDYLAHPKLSVADTFLHAQARAADRGPLLTFDRALARQLPGASLVR